MTRLAPATGLRAPLHICHSCDRCHAAFRRCGRQACVPKQTSTRPRFSASERRVTQLGVQTGRLWSPLCSSKRHVDRLPLCPSPPSLPGATEAQGPRGRTEKTRRQEGAPAFSEKRLSLLRVRLPPPGTRGRAVRGARSPSPSPLCGPWSARHFGLRCAQNPSSARGATPPFACATR